MKKISIVIPTYNEKAYLLDLLESISKINYPVNNFEVIVVSDHATDGTATAVSDSYPIVRIIDLDTNQGRYKARKLGAEATRFDNILFLDSRTLVDPDILNAIDQSDAKAINGVVESGNPDNPYNIFFHSIRRAIYPKFYKSDQKDIKITEKNFESLPKGTTVFYVEKEILFKAYNDLKSLDMGKLSSDDTKLIKAISKYTPITLHPKVKITHFIRSSFLDNFIHLIWRGSTFIDFYFEPSKRLFWLVILLPLLCIIGFILTLIFLSPSWYTVVSILFVIDLLLACYLSTSIREFLHIFYMIPVSSLAFYLGILRGIFLSIFTQRKNKQSKIE